MMQIYLRAFQSGTKQARFISLFESVFHMLARSSSQVGFVDRLTMVKTTFLVAITLKLFAVLNQPNEPAILVGSIVPLIINSCNNVCMCVCSDFNSKYAML